MLIITIREYGLLRLMNHGRVGADQLDFSLVHDLFDLFLLSMRIQTFGSLFFCVLLILFYLLVL